MVIVVKRKLVSVFVCAILMCTIFCIGVSAQEYSTEYPAKASHNSGSPVWLHCRIKNMGDYLIVIDPNTNLQSFGFDSPNGYNLINNTAGTVYGRAYKVGTGEAYSARWASYYKLQLKTGSTNVSGGFEDYDIEEIYGTTLDLIDYTDAGRGNDLYKHDLDKPGLIIVIVLVIIAFILVYQFHFKSRLMRL